MATVTCLFNSQYRAGALTVVGRDILGTEVDIYRYSTFSSTRSLIRGGYGVKVDLGSVIAVDPEVPLGETVVYEIVMMPDGREVTATYESVKSGGCVAEDTSDSFNNDGKCEPVYLSDPLIPSFGYWFGLLGIDPLTHPPRSELFDVLGRAAPVAVSQMRSTPRTSIKLYTKTLGQRDELLGLLGAGRVLLLRNPDPSYPERHWYIAVGDVSEERILTDHRDSRRRWVLAVAVVDRPVGYLSLLNSNRYYQTYRDFEPDGVTPITPATYKGAYSDYNDYTAVLLGGRSAAATKALMGDESTSDSRVMDHVYGDGRYPTTEAARTSWSLS